MLYDGPSMDRAIRSTRAGRPLLPASIPHRLNAATPLVVKALMESYPAWIDENGTNVEQLAAIAVTALYEQGLLVAPEPTLRPRRPVTRS